MMNPTDDTVLAVDGGGTRCRLALQCGASRHLVEVGSANVTSDFHGAVAQLAKGIGALAAKAGLSTAALHATPAYLGLAGITGPDIRNRLAAALPLRHCRIEDDRPIALRGALGAADGAIAHCGTGSFFALQQGGRMRLAGGWGAVLGDEASAQWIGRLALSQVLQAVDGLRPRGPLFAAIEERCGDSAAIVAFAATARPADFGGFAPLVSQYAQAGDAQARALMQLGADHIAATLQDLGWTPDQALCLTGGIAPQYKDYLPGPLQTALIAPQASPLDGALALAQQFREELVT